MTQRLDGISKLKNCPTMGEDIRRAIAASRKVLHPVEADDVEADDVDEEVELTVKTARECDLGSNT